MGGKKPSMTGHTPDVPQRRTKQGQTQRFPDTGIRVSGLIQVFQERSSWRLDARAHMQDFVLTTSGGAYIRNRHSSGGNDEPFVPRYLPPP